MHIYDESTRRSIGSYQLFDHGNIHGLRTCQREGSFDSSKGYKQLLAWAGSSICVAIIDNKDATDCNTDLVINVVIEAEARDWIQDACFPSLSVPKHSITQAIFVTSRNAVFGLRQVQTSHTDASDQASSWLIAAGPPSLLCSAHLLWPERYRGLVAAGSAFGEVLFWSFYSDEALRSAPPVPYRLHYRFVGHEGSVFGIRISRPTLTSFEAAAEWLIVSCSDDRTIRVWDVTGWENTELDTSREEDVIQHNAEQLDNNTAQHVVIAMGHSSRIWGIRCFGREQASMRILSFGEDCSSQIWRLQLIPGNSALGQGRPYRLLEHESTHIHHTGKNVWAIDILESPRLECLIASGGADGRLSLCRLRKGEQKQYVRDTSTWCQYSLQDISSAALGHGEGSNRYPHHREPVAKPQSLSRSMFGGLSGTWTLIRRLTSELPAYPSGDFVGVASFRARVCTDLNFDLEYLYIEEGQFTTQQGATLAATRRYVYRYQQRTEQISAWFVKPEDGETVDYLFHVLDFPRTNPTGDKISLGAHHPCNKDNYWVEYDFTHQNLNLHRFHVKYTVKGPNKDYVADAEYARESKSKDAYNAFFGDIKSVNRSHNAERIMTDTLSLNCPIRDNDSFKSYAWINEKSFLVTTDHGWLLVASIEGRYGADQHSTVEKLDAATVSWTSLVQEPSLRYSCITTSVTRHDTVFITGQDGMIFCFQLATMSLRPLTQLPRKIACLYASSSHTRHASVKQTCVPLYLALFASCIGSSTAYHFMIDMRHESIRFTQVKMNLSAGFVPTSSLFIDSEMIIILGSRKGSMAVYYVADVEDRLTHPEVVVPDIHGGESVTTMEIIPLQNEHGSIYFLSAGRDGQYAMHLLTVRSSQQPSAQTTLQRIHSCSLPIGTIIEGAMFDRQALRLFLWGFQGREFIVWDDSLKAAVMTVGCGGAHRNWAYVPMEDTQGGGNLIWTKASTLNLYSQSQPSHNVLRHGGHGREIKTISISPAVGGYKRANCQYIATGAEDTRIRIFKNASPDENEPEDLKCLTVVSKHTTGIQQLRWSTNGQLLFSVAGREELYVWQVKPVPHFELGIVCLSECPSVSDFGDLRITDVAVLDVVEATGSATTEYILGAVYSDSTLRVSDLQGVNNLTDISQIFHYDSAKALKPFQLIALGHYSGYCLTQALFVRIDTRVHICTTSTDGCIGLWPLDPAKETKGHISNTTRPYLKHVTSLGSICTDDSLNLTAKIQVHQNSINCMSIVELSDDNLLILTVGDDGAFAFTRIVGKKQHRLESEMYSIVPTGNLATDNAILHSTLLIPKAHSSAISTLKCLGSNFAKISDEGTYRFATCGKDQGLKIWRVSANFKKPAIEGFAVFREKTTHISIADVSSLELLAPEDECGPHMLIAGIGIQRLAVDEISN